MFDGGFGFTEEGAHVSCCWRGGSRYAGINDRQE